MALEHSCPSAGDIGDREPVPEPDADRVYEQTQEKRLEKAAEIDDSLGIVLGHMEGIDWADVPTMSTAEAATLTARLIEARDALRERGLDD